MANPSPPNNLPGPGPGRPKGSVNSDVKEIRDMIRQSLEMVGGTEYLATQAIENPVAYMGLIGKIIPKEVSATVKGEVKIIISQDDIDI